MSTARTPPRQDSDVVEGRSPAPADVVIVTSKACHLCEDALEELAGRAHGLTITVIAADTPAGLELVQRHRPVMFPLVLVDGAFLSSGRLPRRKLDKTLAARTRQAVSS